MTRVDSDPHSHSAARAALMKQVSVEVISIFHVMHDARDSESENLDNRIMIMAAEWPTGPGAQARPAARLTVLGARPGGPRSRRSEFRGSSAASDR